MKKLAFLSVAMVAIVTFSACSAEGDISVLKMKTDNKTVDFHTKAQLGYINDDYNNFINYANGTEEISKPNPVKFDWSNWNVKVDGKNPYAYKLYISETSDFQTSLIYTTDSKTYDVYNLKSGTKYYWRVGATNESNTQTVNSKTDYTFETKNVLPRNLNIDGVINARDIGGYTTETGKKVKQGMMFRTGRLNESYTKDKKVVIEVTQNGLDTLLYDLNVKSDIDLRLVDNNEVGGISQSPMEWANYYACPMDYTTPYGKNILTNNKEMVANIFRILAVEDNYPLIFHCNIGTDRTGVIAFLVNGLVGVSLDDLYRDYLFSNFSKIKGMRKPDTIDSYLKSLSAYGSEQDKLSTKIYNCLLDYGVTSEELDAVIDIMLN